MIEPDVSGPSAPDIEPVKKRRKKGTSPAARSLAECRKRGWPAGTVERWNAHVGIKQDLFGVIDIIAITPSGILAIQATTGGAEKHGGRRADHETKILAEPRAKQWVDVGGRLELWTWRKGGAAGKRKLWTLRVDTYAEMAASQDAA